MPGRARGTPCTYQSLTKIRSGPSFHANRSYGLRDIEAPRAALLYNSITEVLRYAVHKFNIPLYGDINSTHVGLPEISQLIDLDMSQTRCFPVAEMHHFGMVPRKDMRSMAGFIRPQPQRPWQYPSWKISDMAGHIHSPRRRPREVHHRHTVQGRQDQLPGC